MEGIVEAVGGGGDGLVRVGGEVWYVPHTAPGDQIAFEVQRQDRGSAKRGRLIRVLSPGPDRVAPPCPHFGKCGGCALQHLSDAHLNDWKVGQVRQALARRGFEQPDLSLALAGTPGSRRRVVLSAFHPRKGVPVLGFHERRGRNIIAVRECPVLEPDLARLIQPLRAVLGAVMSPGSELRIAINLTDNGADMLFQGKLSEGLKTHEALSGFAEAEDVARVSIQDDGPARVVLARRQPVLHWDDLTVSPPPGAFLQASRDAERVMRAQLRDWTEGIGTAVDLFCGVGTLTASLPFVSATLAVDSDGDAVAALRQGLDRIGAPVRTEIRNLFRRPLQDRELAGFDCAVLDPPAAGAKDQAEALATAGPPRVIYVSCAPSSFARDARILADGGYRMTSVKVIDQFTWSADVELMALFTRA